MSLDCGGVVAVSGSTEDASGALPPPHPSQDDGCQKGFLAEQWPLEPFHKSNIPDDMNIVITGPLGDLLPDFSNSELCLNNDIHNDDVSVLTSDDTCFTCSSAISEADSQLCVQDEVGDYDDLTPLTSNVFNCSKATSTPSLAATGNNASSQSSSSSEGESLFDALAISHGTPYHVKKLPQGFEAVLSEVRANAQRRQRDRLTPGSLVYHPLESSKPRPGFEAVLSDVRTYHVDSRRLWRQGTLSSISEAIPSETQSSPPPAELRACADAKSSYSYHKIEHMPSKEEDNEASSSLSSSPMPDVHSSLCIHTDVVSDPQLILDYLGSERKEVSTAQSSLPPPIPPPQRAQSISVQSSSPPISRDVIHTEEETIYTVAVADPLVSVNSSITLTLSERSLFIRKGRCPTCGIQTHQVKRMFKKIYRPLSNEHVLSGRCLICNPINIVTNSTEVGVNDEAMNDECHDWEALPVHRDAKVMEMGTTAENSETQCAPTPTPSAPSLDMCQDSKTGGCDRPKASNDSQRKYFSRTESHDEVEQWLLSHLPTLQKEDVERYYDCLREEGFDSIAMLEVVEEADLSFMKTAHRRVLLKKLLGA